MPWPVLGIRIGLLMVWLCQDGGNGWKLVREFKNLHDSHIFDVKFDATKIVRCVLTCVVY